MTKLRELNKRHEDVINRKFNDFLLDVEFISKVRQDFVLYFHSWK